MFDDVNAFILAGKGTIKLITDGIFNIHSTANSATIYNVVASSSSAEEISIINSIIINKELKKSKLVLSSISIADYNTTEDLIYINNSDISFYNVGIHVNETNKNIIYTDSIVNSYEGLSIYNNITGKKIVKTEKALMLSNNLNIFLTIK